MTSEKYLPPEERARLEAEAAAHSAALEAAGKDSAATRALQMMMHGTLERKEENKVTLVREPWMDIPLKEMTKEQRAALKDFEKRVEELEEETQNHRRVGDGHLASFGPSLPPPITSPNPPPPPNSLQTHTHTHTRARTHKYIYFSL